ncbi:NAD(P)-dependent oxidoreductase [Marinobacterium jannaschii]|uniref:NAD(P)-dependent oxidoreductase n=1 Tax=Marinobacterium jannaschii TaxID=64970 RepID=UPI000487CD55|nr:NAD(P)-dependent oxidoreductase [Marinobacterium jannaschii]
MTTVAFLGIGLMGRPMAENLLKAGFKLNVWNRTLSKTTPLTQLGASAYASAADAVADAEIVITMLENGPVVEQVLFNDGVADSCRNGSLIIDMSSIPPEMAKHHAKRLSSLGMAYLDAPVSGGTVGAEQATLAIMAGGGKADFERAQPLFQALGKATYIGPSGSGQLAKCANQAIVGITIGAVSEALLLAAEGGADPAAVRDALMGGFAASRILELHGERMIERNFVPGATSRVQLKDLNTILDTADAESLTLPLAKTVRDSYQAMIDNGLEERDHSALLLQLEAINNTRLNDKPERNGTA